VIKLESSPRYPAGLDLPIGTTPAGSRWVSLPGPANHPNPILTINSYSLSPGGMVVWGSGGE